MKIIVVHYHIGLRDHRVGNISNRIYSFGLVAQLEDLGFRIHHEEIPHVDDLEGESGCSFGISSTPLHRSLSREALRDLRLCCRTTAWSL